MSLKCSNNAQCFCPAKMLEKNDANIMHVYKSLEWYFNEGLMGQTTRRKRATEKC